MKTIYKDDNIQVSSTGKDYDFIATVTNLNSDHDIFVLYDKSALEQKVEEMEDNMWETCNGDEEAYEEMCDCNYIPDACFRIPAGDFIGIMADDAGRTELELLEEGAFEILDSEPDFEY